MEETCFLFLVIEDKQDKKVTQIIAAFTHCLNISQQGYLLLTSTF